MAGLNERVVSSPVYRGANQLRPGTHRHLITRAQPAVLDAHAQPGLVSWLRAVPLFLYLSESDVARW